MGYGNYSYEAHEAITKSRAARPAAEIFQRNDCDPAMNPRGVKFRESRDSAEHPSSVAIVFALDVSGSMGEIPHRLATHTLPTFMSTVSTTLPDPQILFMAFGNAYADKSPLQVGQFESEANLIDRWLRATHLEGGGGGLGESYELAMYFAARHTAMDCFEKRQKKGYFFMTGDEVPFMEVDRTHVAGLIGDALEGTLFAHDIATELQKTFHTFFLIPDAKRAATERCGAVWQLLFRERCIVLETPDDTASVCALLVGVQERVLTDRASLTRQIDEKLGVSAEQRERLLRAVVPFAEALARGPIAPPGSLSRRTDNPNVKG